MANPKIVISHKPKGGTTQIKVPTQSGIKPVIGVPPKSTGTK